MAPDRGTGPGSAAQADEPPLRVVIAEDSALLREGLASLIADAGATVVAKVADGPAFVQAVVAHRPDVSVTSVTRSDIASVTRRSASSAATNASAIHRVETDRSGTR